MTEGIEARMIAELSQERRAAMAQLALIGWRFQLHGDWKARLENRNGIEARPLVRVSARLAWLIDHLWKIESEWSDGDKAMLARELSSMIGPGGPGTDDVG